jgi:hypothetical protein
MSPEFDPGKAGRDVHLHAPASADIHSSTDGNDGASGLFVRQPHSDRRFRAGVFQAAGIDIGLATASSGASQPASKQ